MTRRSSRPVLCAGGAAFPPLLLLFAGCAVEDLACEPADADTGGWGSEGGDGSESGDGSDSGEGSESGGGSGGSSDSGVDSGGPSGDCETPARPFPQHVSYPGAVISLPGAADELDDAVVAYYERWAEAYLEEVDPGFDGSRRFRVRMEDDREADTVSEAQGYGMVIVATMAGADPDARERFDGLWGYRLDHPSEIEPRMMDWLVPADGSPDPGDDDSAFDGDADMALGLLLADAQWGSGCGVDYRAAAEELLAGLLERVVGPDSRLPLLGDWVPEGEYDEWDLRTSDVVPASFTAFAAVDPAWEDVRTESLGACAAIAEQLAGSTGLLPDFAQDGGDGRWSSGPDYLEGETDGAWSYNAVRVPWRLGFAALAQDDAEARTLALAMSRWMEEKVGGDPTHIRAGYALDGDKLSGTNYFDPLFGATFGPAAMGDPGGQDWLDAIWAAVATEHSDYYSDSVTLQAMLVMTENAWLPE